MLNYQKSPTLAAMINNCFIRFKTKISSDLLPSELNDPFQTNIPPIAQIATKELQLFLSENQHVWKHNFGLTKGKKGAVKGKMFGVLVVQNEQKEFGYLAAFSGKIGDDPHPSIFVPSVFDMDTNDHFITKGLSAITSISQQINALKEKREPNFESKITRLKNHRKATSIHLQEELFSHYYFLNKSGLEKNLIDIFEAYHQKKPPSAAGECAAPKLIQYAYQNQMTPLAISEFWWGALSKDQSKKHKEFYPSCRDKCRPILGYMLSE